MSTGKTFTKSDVSFHPAPVGNNDPGFAIKGHKLRWLSSDVEARRAGRIWQPLKLSQLSKDLQDKFKDTNPTWIDGDTIRRRKMVLSIAPLHLVEERQKQLKLDQGYNEAILSGKTQHGAAVHSGQIETHIERAKGKESDIFK